ncbi:MAG: cysteine--tRNA ligase [Promethearchaeota archaeon]
MVKLYNTLTRKKEIFKPIKDKIVRIYTCGPTVYSYAHLGNLRTFIFEDILKRVLKYNGYKIIHIMNITDVGHLTSQADTGEDKIELAAKKEKKTAWEIADFYTKAFKKDLKLLNIESPTKWIKATETIKDQINLITVLKKRGFAYKIKDGVYFDTSKLKTYGRLWPVKMKVGKKSKKNLEKYARVGAVSGKKNLTDFVLWKFTPEGVKRQMEWDSPWGKGFPGWHTECVVMSVKYLSIPFDIHCGGIDHVLIHHTNEIAQAEAAYGKLPANYWLHGEFLTLKKGKMSKSEGNLITLANLIERGFNPLSFRYLCLTAHYSSKLTFSWENLKSAQNSLKNLYGKTEEIEKEVRKNLKLKNKSEKYRKYRKKFLERINDDLNMPRALALMWDLIRDKKILLSEKYLLLLDFDRVFGLGLEKIKKTKIPKQIKELIKKRELYRQQKKWRKADNIRKKIEKLGYLIEDTKEGPKIKKV